MRPLRWARAELLHLAWKHGRYTPPDRRLLRREILPALASSEEHRRILSVGVAWYTKDDADAFEDETFVTMDVDPARAVYGAREHVTGDVRDLEAHFAERDSFDAILLNGVIGFGLDTADDVERGLRALAARLRERGLLVIGVNEEKRTHVDPSSVPAHRLFEPHPFGRWPSGRVTVPVPFRERTHTFLFWRRR